MTASLACVWCLICATGAGAYPQEGPPPAAPLVAEESAEAQQQLGRDALERMLKGREKIRSAVFSGVMKVSQVREEGKVPTVSSAEFDGAFDAARGRFRFHYRDETEANSETRFIETSEEASIYYPRTKFLETKPPGKLMLRPYQFVDMRSVGVANITELANRRYDELAKYLRGLEEVRAAASSNGKRIELELIEIKRLVERKFFLDIEMDYAPIRMEVRARKTPDGAWSDPVEVVEVEWEERGQVCVPRKATLSNPNWRSEMRSVTFDWSTVNENVDPRVFNLKGRALFK